MRTTLLASKLTNSTLVGTKPPNSTRFGSKKVKGVYKLYPFQLSFTPGERTIPMLDGYNILFTDFKGLTCKAGGKTVKNCYATTYESTVVEATTSGTANGYYLLTDLSETIKEGSYSETYDIYLVGKENFEDEISYKMNFNSEDDFDSSYTEITFMYENGADITVTPIEGIASASTPIESYPPVTDSKTFSQETIFSVYPDIDVEELTKGEYNAKTKIKVSGPSKVNEIIPRKIIKLEANRLYSHDDKDDKVGGSGLSAGAIAGIVIACVVVVGIIVFCIVWFAVLKKGCCGSKSEAPNA